MLCGSWFDPETPPEGLCVPCTVGDGGIDPTLWAGKVLEASHLLFLASGRQFPGLCEDHVNPCEETPVGSAAVTWRSGWPTFGAIASGLGGCGCSGAGTCTLGAVVLPRGPVRSVDTITIAGAELDPSAYALWNGRFVVRTDGARWPCSQSSEWSIDYTYGDVPDPAGVSVAAALACELAAACTPGATCHLPERLRTLTTEGTTIDIADPMEFLRDGRFGFYLVDLWLAQVNPAKIDRAAKVINVDLLGDSFRY